MPGEMRLAVEQASRSSGDLRKNVAGVKMEAAHPVVIVAVGTFVVITFSAVILWLIGRFTSGQPVAPQRDAALESKFRERLLQPQWNELERRFGFAMPQSLHALYSDHSTLLRRSFYIVPPESTTESDHHFVERFEPADVQTLETWFPVGENRFPFASDDFGNYYYVQLDPASEDTPIFFVDHDSGDILPVADSLDELLRWRTYGTDAHEA